MKPRRRERKPVEVVNFVDPYYKRRTNSDGKPERKNQLAETAGKQNVGAGDDSRSAITTSRFNKHQLFGEVFKNSNPLSPSFGKQDSDKEYLASLGCDVSEKVNIPYKLLQARVKEDKLRQKRRLEQQRETNNLTSDPISQEEYQDEEYANNFVKGLVERFGKKRHHKRSAVRRMEYEKDTKKKKHTRSNEVIGELSRPSVGRFKNGVLQISKRQLMD